MTTTEPTYHEPTFRTYRPTEEIIDGRLILWTLAEELDEESGRWEPFYSMLDLGEA